MNYNAYKNFIREPESRNQVDYRQLYTTCFPMIRSMVLKNSGTIDDAKDIFQDAVMALYQNHQRAEFELTAVTSTYLYSIARNKWLNQLRYNGKFIKSGDDDFESDESFTEDEIRKQKQRLLIKHMNSIGEKCQKMLKYYFEGMPGEEIASELGYSSYEYYRVAKNRCIENLKKLMQHDPIFKELK